MILPFSHFNMNPLKRRSSSAWRRASIADKGRHVFFSMVFAVFFIWHCHGIPSLLNWVFTGTTVSCMSNGATAKYMFLNVDCISLQRNGNFCIKELFFLCPVSWKVSWVMLNTAKRRVWHQSGTYCWTRFIDRWPQGGWNVFFSPLRSLEQPRAVLVKNEELLWFVFQCIFEPFSDLSYDFEDIHQRVKECKKISKA